MKTRRTLKGCALSLICVLISSLFLLHTFQDQSSNILHLIVIVVIIVLVMRSWRTLVRYSHVLLRRNIVSRAARRAWHGYIYFLDTYKWRSQILNTAILMGSGDVLAQLVVERRKLSEFEVGRTARFFGCGLLIFGPTMYVWYMGLDRIVRTPRLLLAAWNKMLWDQIVFLPPYIWVYIAVMAKLRGEDNREMQRKCERDFMPVLIASYKLWPAAQMLNFYYIPLKHRIPVMNSIGLLWNTYVGWKAERKSHPPSYLSDTRTAYCTTATEKNTAVERPVKSR